MAVSLLGFFVVRFAFQLLVRPSLLLDPVTASLPNNSFGQREEQAVGMGGWIMSSHTVDAAGRTLNDRQIDNLLVDACNLTRDSPRAAWVSCVERVGLHDVAELHPADHFWALQLWESASFLLLAALLAAGCGWRIQQRTA